MSRIEVKEVKKADAWSVFVDPFFDPDNLRRGHQSYITINSREDFVFEVRDHAWQRATVSWSSIGAVSESMAGTFAKAMILAAEIARKMDAEHKFEVPA